MFANLSAANQDTRTTLKSMWEETERERKRKMTRKKGKYRYREATD